MPQNPPQIDAVFATAETHQSVIRPARDTPAKRAPNRLRGLGGHVPLQNDRGSDILDKNDKLH